MKNEVFDNQFAVDPHPPSRHYAEAYGTVLARFAPSLWIGQLVAKASRSRDPYGSFPILKSRWKVVEWGPGKNTEMAMLCGAQVLSIEHSKQWIPSFGDLMGNTVTYIYTPIESLLYRDFSEMEDADLFFVDGLKRTQCLINIARRCKSEAVVCLHDAQREDYWEGLYKFRFVKFMEWSFAVASHSDKILDLPVRCLDLPEGGEQNHVEGNITCDCSSC